MKWNCTFSEEMDGGQGRILSSLPLSDMAVDSPDFCLREVSRLRTCEHLHTPAIYHFFMAWYFGAWTTSLSFALPSFYEQVFYL
jgi:hypothetical protein